MLRRRQLPGRGRHEVPCSGFACEAQGHAMTHRLFCYGTLRDAAVQREIFGRTLEGRPDALGGYRLKMTRVLDQAFVAASGAEFHRTLDRTGRASDQVEGMALAVSERELALADSYEPAGYQRVLVELASGTSAWVYLSTGE